MQTIYVLQIDFNHDISYYSNKVEIPLDKNQTKEILQKRQLQKK